MRVSNTRSPNPPPPPPELRPLPDADKSLIDLSSALTSTLRAWIAARDTAVWCFVSGTDEVLESPDSEAVYEAMSQMENLRSAALRFADKMADSHMSAQAVIDRAMGNLLSMESPRFSLTVPGVDGSF